MTSLKTLFHSARHNLAQRGFRWEASLILMLSFTVFTILMGLITPLLAARALLASEVMQGEKITTSFAQASVLTLKYSELRESRITAANIKLFPGIVYVAIYDNDSKLILSEGVLPEPLSAEILSRSRLHSAKLVFESDHYWHFSAPVSASQFVTEKAIGYVHVVRSKVSISRLSSDLANYIFILAFGSLLLALVIFVPMVNRLVRPVRRISDTLERAAVNPAPIQVIEEGPPEIAKMVRAFNNLMTLLEERDHRLQEHRRLLESEVHLRTQEAVQARDLAESANRYKSEFLATVSHELRTPLQVVIGYIELVILDYQTDVDSKITDDLKLAMRAANQLLLLINNLLDFAKIEEGKTDILIEPVNLQILAHEVIEMLSPLAHRGRNQISFSVVPENISVNTDPAKVRQIILNLLSNACKFTEGGKITLTIDFSLTEIIITVKDTGRGIAEKDQNSIFEAFRQVRGTSDGTGLGLAIVKRFCKLLDGSVEVESKIGCGSIFTVRLPV